MQKSPRPKLKEKDTQKAILEYLSAKRVFFCRNNSGAIIGHYNGKTRFFRFGAIGSPDIVAVVRGQYVGIEVKGTDGKQSESQQKFESELTNAGGAYILARSPEDVMHHPIFTKN